MVLAYREARFANGLKTKSARRRRQTRNLPICPQPQARAVRRRYQRRGGGGLAERLALCFLGLPLGCRHDQADQVGKRRHAGPLHDGGAMVLDRALADAEDVGDDLIRAPLDD
jgi:hypothetical protein